jgi:Protein of unknown function (DUF1153)
MPSAKDILAKEVADLVLALPPADTRWWPRRKAAVVLAARNGIISREEACRRYAISPEEFAAWEMALDRHGIPGLRSTRLQIYRHAWLRQGRRPAQQQESDLASWSDEPSRPLTR